MHVFLTKCMYTFLLGIENSSVYIYIYIYIYIYDFIILTVNFLLKLLLKSIIEKLIKAKPIYLSKNNVTSFKISFLVACSF